MNSLSKQACYAPHQLLGQFGLLACQFSYWNIGQIQLVWAPKMANKKIIVDSILVIDHLFGQ